METQARPPRNSDSSGPKNKGAVMKQRVVAFMCAFSAAGAIAAFGQGEVRQPGAVYDFDFKGRWDIALGDPATEFGKVCSALGL